MESRRLKHADPVILNELWEKGASAGDTYVHFAVIYLRPAIKPEAEEGCGPVWDLPGYELHVKWRLKRGGSAVEN